MIACSFKTYTVLRIRIRMNPHHFDKPDPDLGGASLFLTILLVAERNVKTKDVNFPRMEGVDF
jgi:hypothetical protein